MKAEVLYFSVALLFLFVFLPLAWIAYKVRRIHLMLYRVDGDITRRVDNLFHQVEALDSLYVDLGLCTSLPATRGWAASPDFLAELVRHAKSAAPRVIVECSSGVSTLVLAKCAQLNGMGHVYSLEHDQAYADKTRKQLERHQLSSWATVLHAPLRSHTIDTEELLWYSEEMLPDDAAIDMLIIDGPPVETSALARYPVGAILFGRLAPGAMIFLDDSNRESERMTIERWQRKFSNLRCERIPCEKGCARLWMA